MTEQRKRLISLDALRGLTIAGMVIVNNPGSWSDAYAQLRHASWNGWTATDMVFPFFLFIVGVAMTFSFARRKEEGADKGHLMLHVLRRGAIIFALGLIINGFPFGLLPGTSFSFATFRIPGVLQRIAVCYVVASVIFLYCSTLWQGIIAVGCLVAYWLAVMLIPVPGYGAGILAPTGNLPWFIDSTLLAGHTYAWAPAPGFDPEGILSTVPSLGTALSGILAGHLLRSNRPGVRKSIVLAVLGVAGILLGLLCNTWFPINKNMWSSSFVLLMGGWASLFLGLFYWIIDVRGIRAWATPFVILGMNAIAVYFFSEVFGTFLGAISVSVSGTMISVQEFFYNHVLLSIVDPVNASLLYALTYDAVMFLLAWILWKKQWFLKV